MHTSTYVFPISLAERSLDSDDIARGNVIEKVNRETIAAAKYAVVQFLNQKKESAQQAPAPVAEKPSPKKK